MMDTQDRARTLLSIPAPKAAPLEQASGGTVAGYNAATGEYNIQRPNGAIANGLPSTIGGIGLGDRAIAQGGVMV